MKDDKKNQYENLENQEENNINEDTDYENAEDEFEDDDFYDEEINLPVPHSRTVNTKRFVLSVVLLAFFVVFILVCAAVIIRGENTDSPQKPSDADISEADETVLDLGFDPSTSYSHAVTDSKIIFYSVDNVKIFSMSGVMENDISLKVSRPMIATAGNYALISDRKGKSAHLFSGSELKQSYTLDTNIILAHVNKNGYSLFVTEDDVHKCAVTVKDSKGEEIFRWKSGSIAVVAAALGDNNRDMALTTLTTDGGVMTSNLYMFNLTKDKPFTNDAYENEIFSRVEFHGNFLYAVGISKTLIYNSYGKCINTIDYSDKELMTYNIDDSIFVLVFADSSVYPGGSMVSSFSSKGAEQGSFAVDGSVSFIDCYGGTIAVSNNRVVSILNSSCKERFQLKTATTLSDFKFVGGTSTAVGISATGAEIINVKK